MGYVDKLKSISFGCKECAGKACWDEDPIKRQKKALAKFGIIPNTCVDDENGNIRCPYHCTK